MQMGLQIASLFLCTAACAQNFVSELNSGTAENLRGVSAVSSEIAWASGTHGTYLKTVNGGQSWVARQVPGAELLDFRDVEAFGSDVAYLLSAGPGEQSRIYKTTDGGKNWRLQFTNKEPKGFLDCMAFWDQEHGIAVGDPVNGKFELVAIEDGQHWKPLAKEQLPAAMEGEGAFAASGTCIAVQGKKDVWFVTGGKVARVFRSRDRGKRWMVAETPLVHGPETAGIFSISFHDRRHGVIGGGDYRHAEQDGANLALSEDGGATWKLSPLTPQWYFSAVAFDKKGNLLALGASHIAYSADEHAGKWLIEQSANLNAVSLFNGTGFAVGPKGAIVRIARPEPRSNPPRHGNR